MSETTTRSLSELQRAIDGGRVAPRDVIDEHRDRARAIGPRLNAFTELTEEGAGADGPLRGVPIAVKDSFVDGDRAPTMGSKVHASWLSGTADVLNQLRGAGATILGYANLHEWAIATTSTVTATGPIRNPWDLDRIAGGSSGGSAAAVAAGIVPAAIGTDAGGSIRIPAACCGVVGLKPTFGAISLAGEPAAASPVNTLGVIARNVADVAYVFRLLAERREEHVEAKAMRLGVARAFFCDDVHPDIASLVEDAVATVGRSLREVTEVEVSGADEARNAISASVLAHVAGLLRDDIESRPDDFDPWTLAMLRHGSEMAKEPTPDLARVRRGWETAFESCDVIAVPTLPAPVPRIDQRNVELPAGAKSADLAQLEINTPMNVGGVPAVAVPCGEVDGMPMAVTFVAPPGREDFLFAVGQALEDALDRAYADRIATSG